MTKRRSKRVPKMLLVDMLTKLGLTLERVTFMDRRMWKVGDEYFSSLHAVFKKFRYPKSKKKFEQIKPIVNSINNALS